ncbi:MAG: aminotransferase class V-fold PLP-dependent enzyme [Chitinophagaceae bacterium]
MNYNSEPNKKTVYFNTAGSGLLSKDSVEAACNFQQATLINSSAVFLQWLLETLPELRKKTAKLLGASENEVAFVPNFSYGLLPVIDSLKPHLHKVLLYKEDYPSLNLPFELSGFETTYVESPDGYHIHIDDIKKAIDKDKPEIVAISEVQFLTGFRTDISELGKYCKEKDIVFIVDGTQSSGAINHAFSKMPVDVVISSSYKWLNGGFGSAVLCIKEGFFKKFPPAFAGYGSMKISPDNWEYTPSFKSFEPGHMNASGLLQLEKAIDEKLVMGLENIEQHNQVLIKKLLDGLTPLPYKIKGCKKMEERLSIVCFEADETLYNYLTGQGFTFTWRKGLIRVAPHFYNTEEEIEELLQALKEYKR